LALNSNSVEHLPKEIGRLTRLESLWIAWNTELKHLPTSIGQLTGLKKLMIHDNRLQSLPEDIGKLINLEWLGIANNELKILPTSLFQLTNLKKLELQKNRLRAISPDIGELISLEHLCLQTNKLDFLPPSLCKLSNLRKLELAGNNLESLPAEMGQLYKLEKLQIQSNKLKYLPSSMVQLDLLKDLWLYGNPLEKSLLEEYKKGISYLLEFLKKQSYQVVEQKLVEQKALQIEEDKERQKLLKEQKDKEKQEHIKAKQEVEKFNKEYIFVEEASPLYTWLEERELETIYENLMELGAESIEDLKFLNEKDLEANIKPLPRRRLFAEISKYFYQTTDFSNRPTGHDNDMLKMENKALQDELAYLKDMILDKENFEKYKAPYLEEIEKAIKQLNLENSVNDENFFLAAGDEITKKIKDAVKLLQEIKSIDQSSLIRLK